MRILSFQGRLPRKDMVNTGEQPRKSTPDNTKGSFRKLFLLSRNNILALGQHRWLFLLMCGHEVKARVKKPQCFQWRN